MLHYTLNLTQFLQQPCKLKNNKSFWFAKQISTTASTTSSLEDNV